MAKSHCEASEMCPFHDKGGTFEDPCGDRLPIDALVACEPPSARNESFYADCPNDGLDVHAANALSPIEVALLATLLARDLPRLSALARAEDPTEQLDDGSLLRVVERRRKGYGTTAETGRLLGYRIEHVTRSAPSEPKQTWELNEKGEEIRRSRRS